MGVQAREVREWSLLINILLLATGEEARIRKLLLG